MPKIEVGVEGIEVLRPFVSLGLDPQRRPGSRESHANCPFCGKEAKFIVNCETSEWHCWSCGAKGNALSFLRQLWEASDKATRTYDDLRQSRKLLLPETLGMWGTVRSVITGEWLIAGYGIDGQIDQLYRWCRVPVKQGKWVMRLIPTPGVWPSGESHALFGLDSFDPTKPNVLVDEGCWDGMASWEVVKSLPPSQDSFTVMATPGCDVWHEKWGKLLAGKRAFLMFDNDHPRMVNGSMVDGAALVGVKRIAALLSGSDEPPAEIHCLWWGQGDEFHDPLLRSGYDCRDFLAQGSTLSERASLFGQLMGKCRPVPAAWLRQKGSVKKSRMTLESLACRSWKQLIDGWEKAQRWRQGLSDVLAIMVAVAISTSQLGDQLFLQVIGPAGSAKSRLCDGLLVSKGCHALEHLTGFHSGYNDGTGKDYSLLERINHKTLVTPEGDVMMSSPRFDELMSQQRRIFDGTSGATYKTRDDDKRWVGLRTPWIMAGTPALLDRDQSRLGDRFIKIWMDEPNEDERKAILRRVSYTAFRSVLQTSDGVAEGQIEANIGRAYRLTGGYVDYLRANTAKLLAIVTILDEDLVFGCCEAWAEFAALMRARPHPDPKRRDDAEVTTELPTRLTHQFVRLTRCLAVVLNKTEIDSEVLRIVRKVALDTARGRTLELVTQLAAAGTEGMSLYAVALSVGKTEDRCRTNLKFLQSIGVVEIRSRRIAEGMSEQIKWRLTTRIIELWLEVMKDA